MNLYEKHIINLPPVHEEYKTRLLNLPRYKHVTTERLFAAVKDLPGGHRIVCRDRSLAISLLVGYRNLDDPLFQQPIVA
jgi:hypothetical protein